MNGNIYFFLYHVFPRTHHHVNRICSPEYPADQLGFRACDWYIRRLPLPGYRMLPSGDFTYEDIASDTTSFDILGLRSGGLVWNQAGYQIGKHLHRSWPDPGQNKYVSK